MYTKIKCVFRNINANDKIFHKFEFTESEVRDLNWKIAGGGHMLGSVCTYFRNTDRGLDCTAQNCPCGDYEAEGAAGRKNGGVECDTESGPCACGAWH